MKCLNTTVLLFLATALSAQQPQTLSRIDSNGKPRHDAVAYSPSGQSLFIESEGLIYKAHDPAGNPENAGFEPVLRVRDDLPKITTSSHTARYLLPINDRLVVYVYFGLYLLDTNSGEIVDTWEMPEEFRHIQFASVSPDQESIGVTFYNLVSSSPVLSIHLFSIQEDKLGLNARIDDEGLNRFFTYHPTDGTILTTHVDEDMGPGNYKIWNREGELLETKALTDLGRPFSPTQVTINPNGDLIEVVGLMNSGFPFPPSYPTQYVIHNPGAFNEFRVPNPEPLISQSSRFPIVSHLSPNGRFVIFALGAADTMADSVIRPLPGFGNAANTAFKGTHSYLYGDSLVSIDEEDPRAVDQHVIATFPGEVRFSRTNNTLVSPLGSLNLSTRAFTPVPLNPLGEPLRTIIGNENSWQIQRIGRSITLYRYSDLSFPFFEHEEFQDTPSYVFQVLDDSQEEATMVILRRSTDTTQSAQDLIVADIRGASKELKLLRAALPLLNRSNHFLYLRGNELIAIERDALIGQSTTVPPQNYKVSLETGESESFSFDPLVLDRFDLDPGKITDYDDHFMISDAAETRHVLMSKDNLKPVMKFSSEYIDGASTMKPGSTINDGILPFNTESEVLLVSLETGLAAARVPNEGFQDASVNGDRAFLSIDDGAVYSYEFPTVAFENEDPLIQQILGKSRLIADRDSTMDGVLDVADLIRSLD